MPDHDVIRKDQGWRTHPLVTRVTPYAAQLVAAVSLATGLAGTLAARQRNPGNRDGGHHRDAAQHRDHHGEQPGGRGEQNHAGSDHDRDSLQQRSGRGSGHHGNSAVGDEAKQTPTPTPTPTLTSHGNGSGGNGGGSNAGGQSHGQSNAGSGVFDSSLATKAGRRANDFGNHDGGGSQSGAISYTSGPDGLEIHTTNIDYTAAPTPTPTPFPQLELPDRGGFVTGSGAATPTVPPGRTGGVVAPTVHATTGGSQSGVSSSDPGDGDTSGGNLHPDFMS